MKSIVIFGGSGFVGKNLVRILAKNGFKIIVPYQTPTNEPKLRLLGGLGQVIPIYFSSLKDRRIKLVLQECSICINLKTTWDKKKGSFIKNIFEFNSDLISILNKNNSLEKYIFFSGLGIDKNDKSLRNQAIVKTENYLKATLANVIIIRPGVIIGDEDHFLKKLLPIFKLFYLIPLFGDGKSKFQPVFIDDVSIIIKRIVLDRLFGSHIFELAGPNVLTYSELYKEIAINIGKKRVFVPFPLFISKVIIGIAEKTPFSPINLEQLSLFTKDNIETGIDKDFSFYNISPQDTLGIIKKICIK